MIDTNISGISSSDNILRLNNSNMRPHEDSIHKFNKDTILEDIHKNIKELDQFINLNNGLKKLFCEIIQFYFNNDQESIFFI